MKVQALLSSVLLSVLASPAISQTAGEIITRSEDLMKGESSRGSFRMTIVTPDFTRTMEMDSWWVGTEKALVVVKSPRREAGNKTLKVNNEQVFEGGDFSEYWYYPHSVFLKADVFF